MYVTDLISKYHNDVIFHFDTQEIYNYVMERRNIESRIPGINSNFRYKELNQQLLSEFVKINYKNLTPILEKKLKER